MLLFPAIDLKDGQVVRLYRGDFATVHRVAEDPIATARTFYAAGARHLHVVDLDGARDGRRQNSAIVRRLTDQGLQVELGGGLRSMADLEAAFALGVWRVVIGSAAVSSPDLVSAALDRYGPEHIAVGIDAGMDTSAPPDGQRTPAWRPLPLQSVWNQLVYSILSLQI